MAVYSGYTGVQSIIHKTETTQARRKDVNGRNTKRSASKTNKNDFIDNDKLPRN